MAYYNSSDISSGSKYGYKDGGNGLTTPIHYPNNLSARNDITGDAIRTGYKNQDIYSENFDKIFGEKLKKNTNPKDYDEDSEKIQCSCIVCSRLFNGNSTRTKCALCNI